MQTSLGAPESDDCMHDVFLELFFVGLELVAGGGGAKPPIPGKQPSAISNTISGMSLIDLASAGKRFYLHFKQ